MSDKPFISLDGKQPLGLKANGSQYRLLIVDDSVFIIKQLQQILSSEGFIVAATAANGREGLEKYKELYPNIDLVTLDITMPDMDGLACLEELLAFDKKTKVVMVSAVGKEEKVKKALLLGAKNFIVKPLDRKKIIDRIVQVLQKA
jgi:two-component system chemotaxis response regulator CheY